MPQLMSNQEFLAYLQKTYPELTLDELLEMCPETGDDLTEPGSKLPTSQTKQPAEASAI